MTISVLKWQQIIELKMSKKLNIINTIAKKEYKDSKDFLNDVIEYMIELTESKIGYLYYYNDVKKEFILHAWSSSVMPACKVMNKKTIYNLEDTGCWGDVVRENKPIIINDYESYKDKKGIPSGHVQLNKFLSVPVYSDGKIVAVAGVANKETNYNQEDIDQLAEFTTFVWHINEFRETKNCLEKELINKDIILKEAEHRILNNLMLTISILNITYDYIQDEQSLIILKETAKRIETIASIHKSLYKINQTDIDKINIKKYIEDIFSTNIFLDILSYNINIDNVDIDTKKSMIIGLMLNELVTNSIKYAWPEGIHKECILNINIKIDDNLTLNYYDNGIGNKNTKKGIGSIILDLFSQQLDAKVEQYSENGLHYNIIFKL